jgi:UDP-N-acetyl-D-mannosaminuronic acid transferase (WecB/TagA/CpsF family)
MSDTEILNWVAEHLSSFQPMIESAHMVYIDASGFEQKVQVHVGDTFNRGVPCIDLLKACVLKAIENECVQS